MTSFGRGTRLMRVSKDEKTPETDILPKKEVARG
jgi:hypothetical protein